jgi:hypothetical protein
MRRKTLLHLAAILAASVWCVRFGVVSLQAAPPVPICDEVCSSSGCDGTCYVNMMEFENGNDISCLQYGAWDGSICCGDGICDGESEFGSCNADCPPPPEACGECSIEAQDCADGKLCVTGGCCVAGCGPDDCGGDDRSCEGGATTCNGDNDCCPDEFCLSVQCFQNTTCTSNINFGPQCSQNPYNQTRPRR